jgi:hypothetical protein
MKIVDLSQVRNSHTVIASYGENTIVSNFVHILPGWNTVRHVSVSNCSVVISFENNREKASEVSQN